MDTLSGEGYENYLRVWASDMKSYVDKELIAFLGARQDKVGFKVPTSLQLNSPLAISNAAFGARLTAFREVMNYDNLSLGFAQSAMYEAAGTIWMVDALLAHASDVISISQLESAFWTWSHEAFLLSSKKPLSRRFSFDVPFPAKAEDAPIVQRKGKNSIEVVMGTAVPMLAGRALVIAWYGAMGSALQADDQEETVFRLFEAALSVPIRLRLAPDDDACHQAALFFGFFLCSGGSLWRGIIF